MVLWRPLPGPAGAPAAERTTADLRFEFRAESHAAAGEPPHQRIAPRPAAAGACDAGAASLRAALGGRLLCGGADAAIRPLARHAEPGLSVEMKVQGVARFRDDLH